MTNMMSTHSYRRDRELERIRSLYVRAFGRTSPAEDPFSDCGQPGLVRFGILARFSNARIHVALHAELPDVLFVDEAAGARMLR